MKIVGEEGIYLSKQIAKTVIFNIGSDRGPRSRHKANPTHIRKINRCRRIVESIREALAM